MKTKTNFIFDLYGTLIDVLTDESRESCWRILADAIEQCGGSLPVDRIAAAESEYHRGWNVLEKQTKKQLLAEGSRIKYPEIDIENVFKEAFNHCNANAEDFDFPELINIWRKSTVVKMNAYKPVKGLLKALKERGGKIYLLTNAQTVFTPNEISECGLAGAFDGICYSSKEKVAKPDPEFFDILFSRFDLSLQDSVFIGNDKNVDKVGAKAYGVDFILVKNGVNEKAAKKILKLAPR